ncbi:hypothetical protein KHQ06_16800 [Nocardia tengchongensis]|uniref:Uncharacterized protein n=1 Tax=Nocardia tengchongensis TaxID=2055889 RepID=A0ABX8CWJ8_9NOCA|nr:hypothetical protein [Nocardia tengchongensis]QVI24275.1 hypothetical protein KHQ06_16800 [Nocardia tengchongensis]
MSRRLIAVGSLAAGLIMTTAGCGSNTTPPAVVATPGPARAITTVAPKPAFRPTPDQISLSLKVVKKTCYGSAGCNVFVQIDPSFGFSEDIPAGQKWTVIYEIDGGEDGPKTNSFVISRGSATGQVNYRFDKKELVSTSGPNDVLTAIVTDVIAGDAS